MNAHFRNSDDEEDLEALRLAALQSLKRRSPPRAGDGRSQFLNNGRHRRGGGKFGGRPMPSWNPQSNHQFNNWTRNSNLISIPVISNDDKNQSGEQTPAPKLILPQDRYCNAGKPANPIQTENNSQSSKFDRYNDSDQSEESESEIEDQNQLNQGGSEKDEDNGTKPLTRHDSLEALMAELENEIQGGTGTGNKKPDSTGTTVKKSKETENSTKEGKSQRVKSPTKKLVSNNKPSECDSSTQQPVTATVTTADSSVTNDSLCKENQQPPETVEEGHAQQNVTSSPSFERKRSPEFARSGEFGGRKYYDENRFLHRKRHKWEAPSYTNRHSFPLPQQMAHNLGLPSSPIKTVSAAGGDMILPPFQSSVPPPNVPQQRLPLIPGGPPLPLGVLPPGAPPGFLPYNLPQQQVPFENAPMLFGQQQQQQRVPPPVPVIFDVPPPHLATAAAARALAATVFVEHQKRPLSPLTINTSTNNSGGGGPLPATTFGQLSPRSAAFVLENRAIIERRKRRSYSRSPSPPSPLPPSSSGRYTSRRSKSPLPPMTRRKSYSPLPIRRRSSLSPLPPPPSRRALSPPKHGNNSGSSRGGALTKTDGGSSANSGSGKNAGTSPKKPIHDRLGVKPTSSSSTTSTSASTNKTDINSADNDKNKKSTTSSSSSSSSATNRDEKKSDVLLDPVLEARRRKFESNQITMKEGVIRLNKAKEATEKQKTEEKESVVEKEPARKITQGSLSPKIGNAAKQVSSGASVPATPTTTATSKPKEADGSPKPATIETKVSIMSSSSTLTLKTGSSSDLDLNLSDIDEDALLEEDPEEALMRVLFSDEESNSDNEGRFKVEQQSGNSAPKKVTVLPFTKLVNNGTSAKKSTPEPRRNASSRDNRTGVDRDSATSAGRSSKVGNTDRTSSSAGSSSTMKRRFRSRSPPSKRAGDGGRSSAKKIALDPGSRKPSAAPAIQFPLESSRKIEIKIRNPSKYELSGIADEISTNSGGKREDQPPNKTVNISSGGGGSVRKVELASRKSDSECAPSTSGSGSSGKNKEEATSAPAASNAVEESDGKANEGDLRAQLSRKRAERQKHPLPDVVPSRLLQNALQEVGFKKAKKHKKSKEEMPDGKLPIHLRLGLAAEKSPETSKSFSKKSRKRGKNKGSGGGGNNSEQAYRPSKA